MVQSGVQILSQLLLLFSITVTSSAEETANHHQLRINEVSDKGNPGLDGDVCNGTDWVELYYGGPNNTTSAIQTSRSSGTFDLSGYVLHDDKGPNNEDAFVFPESSTIGSGEYLVLCMSQNGEEDTIDDQSHFKFGIGGMDSVTLLDSSGAVVSTTGNALKGWGSDTVALAYNDVEIAGVSSLYVYTSTPTPGKANILTQVVDPVKELRDQLEARNELGVKFFNMDDNGLPVQDGLLDTVDLHMEIEPAKWEQMYLDRGYEIYEDFLSAVVTVTTTDNDSTTTTVLANLTSPGRLRPKGQSTMYLGTCSNRTVPYRVDWDYSDKSQTLFGMTRSYLRTHMNDNSGTREWMAHRMMARFGLPFLRTRTVRYHVNGNYVGLYELMEVPEEEYVFARNFPTSFTDGSKEGLYKMKTMTNICGEDDNPLKAIVTMMGGGSSNTPIASGQPLSFEKGKHRSDIPLLLDDEMCMGSFMGTVTQDLSEIDTAQASSNKTCGEYFVEKGILDRDLGGSKEIDNTAADFFNRNVAKGSACVDNMCSNSNLSDDVDVNQFLKNIAFMVAVLHLDSPLSFGNNYYLAHVSSSSFDPGWKMQQYDHNNMLSTGLAAICDPVACVNDIVQWSIDRPTCRNLEKTSLIGPLLTNTTLRTRYLEYMREFHKDVMTNEDFLDQIRDHLILIQDDMAVDPWTAIFAPMFPMELSPDNDQWNQGSYQLMLPMLRARSDQIGMQLDAMDKGTFPRTVEMIDPSEVCVNWESTTARPKIDISDACPENCLYDGCHRPELTIPSQCNFGGGCIHGTIDENCNGVADLAQYEGMENFDGSNELPYCFTIPQMGNVAMKFANCPPPPIIEGEKQEELQEDDEVYVEEENGEEKGSTTTTEKLGGDSSAAVKSVQSIFGGLYFLAGFLFMVFN